MAWPHLTKSCPQCGEAVSGWHRRLFGGGRTITRDTADGTPGIKLTSTPFACSACGANLLLSFADPHLVHKLAAVVFASIVAGFVLAIVVGIIGCFVCDLLLIGLLEALTVPWIIARAVRLDMVKRESSLMN